MASKIDKNFLLQHFPPTRKMIEFALEQQSADCHTKRVKMGHKLGWKTGFVDISRKGQKAHIVKKTYPVYYDQDGDVVDAKGKKQKQDIAKGLPACKIVSPPGPATGVWISMMNAITPPKGEAWQTFDKAQQRIVMDHECIDDKLYPEWIEFVKDMNTLTRDERINHLVDSVADHDLMSNSDRTACIKNPERAKEDLLRHHDDDNHTGQRLKKWWSIGHKILKKQFAQLRDDGTQVPIMKVSPKDSKILCIPGLDPTLHEGPFEGKNVIRTYLNSKPDKEEMCLDLLQINLPQEGYVIEPTEIDKVHASGGVFSIEFSVYSLHERVDKNARQISIPIYLDAVHMITNGLPYTKTVQKVSMADYYTSQGYSIPMEPENAQADKETADATTEQEPNETSPGNNDEQATDESPAEKTSNTTNISTPEVTPSKDDAPTPTAESNEKGKETSVDDAPMPDEEINEKETANAIDEFVDDSSTANNFNHELLMSHGKGTPAKRKIPYTPPQKLKRSKIKTVFT